MRDLFGKILKWLVYASAAGIMLLALIVGIARLFLPLVPQYQDDIRRWAADATGFDVAFESISASWPFAGPELRLIDVTLSSRETGEPIFVAENLTAGISLLLLIRDRKALLNRLGVEGSALRLRRAADGSFYLQDQPIDQFIRREIDPEEPLRLPDVLIKLSDINLSYVDESRSGDVYAFGVEQLEIELSPEQIMLDGEIDIAPEFGRHASISMDLPARLLMSEAAGGRNDDARRPTRDAQGWRIFVDGEGLQFREVINYILNRESPVAAAQGDATISASFLDFAPQSVSAELDIADVRLLVGADRTEQYEVLSGRLEWNRNADRGWLLAGTDISVERRDLFAPRSDFAVAVQPAASGGAERIRASASFLRLQDLYPLMLLARSENLLASALAEELQLPRDIYGDVKSFDLRADRDDGVVNDFSVAVQFSDAGVVGLVDDITLRGISGELTADQSGGRAEIDGQDGELALPALLSAPVALRSISALLVWRTNEEGTHVLSDNVRISMESVEANTRFELDLPIADESPRIDLTATGTATDARQLVSLLPLKKFPPQVAGWLGRALVAGRMTRGEVRFTGPLRKFPFAGGEGVFIADIDIEGGILDFADGWPRIENIDARVVFDGVSLTTKENSGRTGGIDFRNSDAHIADLRKGVLELRGRQSVPVNSVLNYLRRSPVADATGPIIDKATGGGSVNADLKLVLPVTRPAEYSLEIMLDARNAALGLAGIDWGLTDIGGALTVRNTKFYADALTATLLGEPVALELRPAADTSELYGQFIRVSGRIPVERWLETLSLPFSDRVNGWADWNALVLIPQRQQGIRPPVHIIARSDLVGIESRMPDPLAKTADQARAFEVDIAFPADGELEIAGRLRDELTWAFELASAEDRWRIARGAVHAGSAAAIVPALSGVEITGRVDFLRFDDWLALNETEPSVGLRAIVAPRADWQETWREATLDVDRLSIFGQVFPDVQIEARQDAQNWQIRVDGPAAAGNISVPLDLDTREPIAVNMERVWLVDTEVEPETVGVDKAPSADPRLVPPIDAKVADFVINDMHFGSLETVIQSVPGGILADPIAMQAPTFRITGDAAWLVHPNDEYLRQTRLALSLTGAEIQTVLVELGYDPFIVGKSVAASGNLTWLGGPSGDFLERADGDFSLRMEEGSVLAVNPGSGRLLGVLSLAALPRRLSFDFSDVFDDGLSFDTLKGDFKVDDGNAYTCNLSLEGSVADMGIAGRAGFETQDYDQLAVVRPHVSTLLAVPAVVVGGPVAGAAMLLFSQIFRKPLSTLGESYYSVKGSWQDPVIDQIRGNELDGAPLRNCEAYLSNAITESLKE